MKFENIGNNIKKLVERFTKVKNTTNSVNCITEQLIVTKND